MGPDLRRQRQLELPVRRRHPARRDARVDHNTFTDASHFDSANPKYYGREYQIHDGDLDITKGSDLVTVERNQFTNHDKTMLIGSSDTDSVGKLRDPHPPQRVEGDRSEGSPDPDRAGAPLQQLLRHHDRQRVRAPRQHQLPCQGPGRRRGQLLEGPDGREDLQAAQRRRHRLDRLARGNLVNGTSTDLVAAYNAANSKKLKTTVNWTPTLNAGVQSSAKNLPTELGTTTGAVLTN